MNDRESAFRVTVVTAHLAASGINGDEVRLKALCHDTGGIPVRILADACQLARQLNVRGYPPDAGAIIAAALSVSPHEHDPGYQGNPRDQRPEWYVEMIRSKRRRARRVLTAGGAAIPAELLDGVVEALTEENK